jgi:hypothetical protein
MRYALSSKLADLVHLDPLLTAELADASAYLLERMGNVTSALQFILQTLENRMMA